MQSPTLQKSQAKSSVKGTGHRRAKPTANDSSAEAAQRTSAQDTRNCEVRTPTNPDAVYDAVHSKVYTHYKSSGSYRG